MTNEQLRAFIVVVEQGSFRSAAVKLFKTQPTVSAAVQSLEQEFNFKLFSREGYRPALTLEGKAFYIQAKRILADIKQLEKLGHQLSDGLSPSLSICINVICVNTSILNKINYFSTLNPEIKIDISGEHLHGVKEQLETIDLGIGPRYGLDDRHEFIEIDQVDMITVAAPDYIQSKSNIIRHQELYQYPHILIANPNVKDDIAESHINVLDSGKRWFVNDYQMKKELLLAKMGWARIPKHMIEVELETGQLTPLTIDNFDFRSKVPIYIIKIRNQSLSLFAENFWKYISTSL